MELESGRGRGESGRGRGLRSPLYHKILTWTLPLGRPYSKKIKKLKDKKIKIIIINIS